MSENLKLKEKDLIDKKEYRRRRKEFFQKHIHLFQYLMKLGIENKISWGTIVERNAQEYSDKVAIKFEDISLTYKEFNEQVNRYAHYFISLGLKKGDVVEIFMTNRPELLIIFTAIGKIGAINSLINTELREKTLAYCLNLTPGKLIIISSELIHEFTKVKSELNLSNDQILLFSPDKDSKLLPNGFIDLRSVINDFPSYNPPTTSEVRTNDPLVYFFTSGTTGLSKAATVIHRSLIFNGYAVGLLIAEVTPDDTIYVALPFFHATAVWLGWAPAFAGGAALALGRKFSASSFWEEIRKYNATVFTYVGEFCRYLINQPPSPDDRNNSVRAIIGNGLRPEIWKEFKKRFDIDIVAEAYGASENVAGFANLFNFDCTIGTCVAPYAIVKFDPDQEKPIRGEDGFMQKVGLGETGLCIFECKGITEFRGYTDKKATEEKLFHNVFKQGDLWFNTGDLLRDLGCDHAQFVDRLGDTFRWKGHNVSTTEIEEVINVFDKVLMSSVYGVQIPGTEGRAGMAAIVISCSLEDFNLKALTNKFRKRLPPYAIPIFLRFKADLAITPTFKLKKITLKKEGFDFNKINDPLYVMLPNESEYCSLTKNIFENIKKKKYKF